MARLSWENTAVDALAAGLAGQTQERAAATNPREPNPAAVLDLLVWDLLAEE